MVELSVFAPLKRIQMLTDPLALKRTKRLKKVSQKAGLQQGKVKDKDGEGMPPAKPKRAPSKKAAA